MDGRRLQTLTDLAVVDEVEEDHGAGNQLEHGRDSSLLGLHVLVLPPPPGTAHRAHEGGRRLVTPAEPFADLAQLDLAKGNIGCNQNYGMCPERIT